MYATLTDAFPNGRNLFNESFKIWYYKDEFSRDASFGREFCEKHDCFPIDIEDMTKSHVLLGEVTGFMNLESILIAFQGENWSPMGEARDLIRSKGLSHTSMSIGDLIEVDGKFWVIDRHPMFVQLEKKQSD